jgi:hypothetical protein
MKGIVDRRILIGRKAAQKAQKENQDETGCVQEL